LNAAGENQGKIALDDGETGIPVGVALIGAKEGGLVKILVRLSPRLEETGQSDQE
jgi:hypothetical protein